MDSKSNIKLIIIIIKSVNNNILVARKREAQSVIIYLSFSHNI